jgi:hypothetical protein
MATPYLNNDPTLDIDVGGTDIVFYSFAIVTDATPCSSASYSSEIPVSTNITGSLSGEGVVRLCVIGKNSVGVWQDMASATTHVWEYDGSPPTLNSIASPAGEYGAGAGMVTVTPTGTDLFFFKFKTIYRKYSDPVSADTCANPVGYTSNPAGAGTSINLNMDILGEGDHTLCVIGGDDAGNWQDHSVATSASWVIVRPALRAGLTSDGSIYNASQAKFFPDLSVAKIISFFKLDEDTTTGTNMGAVFGGYDAKLSDSSTILVNLDPRVVSVSKSPEYGGGYWGLMSYGAVVKLNNDGTPDFGGGCPFDGGCSGFERFESISVGRTDHLYVLDHEGRIYDVRDLSTARGPLLDPRVKQVSYW